VWTNLAAVAAVAIAVALIAVKNLRADVASETPNVSHDSMGELHRGLDQQSTEAYENAVGKPLRSQSRSVINAVLKP
jgi:hypothetical protein